MRATCLIIVALLQTALASPLIPDESQPLLEASFSTEEDVEPRQYLNNHIYALSEDDLANIEGLTGITIGKVDEQNEMRHPLTYHNNGDVKETNAKAPSFETSQRAKGHHPFNFRDKHISDLIPPPPIPETQPNLAAISFLNPDIQVQPPASSFLLESMLDDLGLSILKTLTVGLEEKEKVKLYDEVIMAVLLSKTRGGSDSDETSHSTGSDNSVSSYTSTQTTNQGSQSYGSPSEQGGGVQHVNYQSLQNLLGLPNERDYGGGNNPIIAPSSTGYGNPSTRVILVKQDYFYQPTPPAKTMKTIHVSYKAAP